MPQGKCVFHLQKWKDSENNLWLENGKDEQHARCRLCKKDININGGVGTNLASHARSKKHIELASAQSTSVRSMMPLYFSLRDDKQPSSSSAATSSQSVASQSGTSQSGTSRSGTSQRGVFQIRASAGGNQSESSQNAMEASMMMSLKVKMEFDLVLVITHYFCHY